MSSNPYPVNLLVSMYQTKRRRMEKHLAKFEKHIQVPSLLIDGLCRQLGEKVQVTINIIKSYKVANLITVHFRPISSETEEMVIIHHPHFIPFYPFI